ncbi:hypothetical protein ACFU8I_00630 [Streptomyces sp. NPDC057540]|uniref:hypothetical protein n=1 Tax=Streptomyces sp. NPDC057540 TaxID=3346160 RepID=UPI003678C5B0
MRRHATTTALAIVLLTLVGCTTSTKPTRPGKYEQTWRTPYSSTSCGNYLTTLDAHQQWVLAADMLTGARKVDGATVLPDDTDVDRFRQDITTACEAQATAMTTEVGATLYLLDPSYKP